MRFRNTFAPACIALFFACIPLAASAHIVKTDGTIGALLHIYPDDDPIATEPAVLNFAFTGRTSHLDLSQCDCSLVVSEAGHQLSRQAIPSSAKNGNYAITINYAFPKRDVYTLSLQGKPIGGTAFQTFKLNYDIRVQREPVKKTSSQTTEIIAYSTLGVVLAFGALVGLRRYLF